ncbi:hypothetical protein [Eleftheria terrae]|uniref:hypothetical protein n=1 Tax=Eleftheria terrae TaxID=1597781 RepID=UPI00263B85C1|nr:hypothetical protein [Eleftheria terrae]WKB52994.1 hypothetical protein N7L95_00905 [Eleftheria terrae]
MGLKITERDKRFLLAAGVGFAGFLAALSFFWLLDAMEVPQRTAKFLGYLVLALVWGVTLGAWRYPDDVRSAARAVAAFFRRIFKV